jgi:hypothetical protein
MTMLHSQPSEEGPFLTNQDEKNNQLTINVLPKTKKNIEAPIFESSSALNQQPKQ